MNDREKVIQYAKIMRASSEKILEILDASKEESLMGQQLIEPQEEVPEEAPEEVVPEVVEEEIPKFEPAWDDWPEAVPSFLLSSPTPLGIAKRARSVLDMCDLTNLQGKSFLDFGCGDGSMVKEAMIRGATVAHGYDPKKEWEPLEGIEDLFFTTEYSKLSKGYDVILVYDVIDHTIGESPIDVLNKVRELIADTGEVKIRCHPFTSKHANHVYRTFNKAYSQMFLTPEQLEDHNPEPIFMRPGIDPLDEYKRWFDHTGFDIRKVNALKNPVDRECLKNIPRAVMKAIINHENYQKILEIQFVDYHLTPRR